MHEIIHVTKGRKWYSVVNIVFFYETICNFHLSLIFLQYNFSVTYEYERNGINKFSSFCYLCNFLGKDITRGLQNILKSFTYE